MKAAATGLAESRLQGAGHRAGKRGGLFVEGQKTRAWGAWVQGAVRMR